MNIQLNKFEKVMIVIYLLVLVGMILCPPWAYYNPETGAFIKSFGSSNIFDTAPEGTQIQFSVLIYQIFVVSLLWGLGLFAIRKVYNLFKKSAEVDYGEAVGSFPYQDKGSDIPNSPTILRRYLSTFIDAMFILVVFVALSFVFKDNSSSSDSIRLLVFFVMFFCYEPIFTSMACTVGQKITGIRVRTLNTHQKISILSAYIRIVVKILLGFLSLLSIPLTKGRRAVHDYAAGSIVIMAYNSAD